MTQCIIVFRNPRTGGVGIIHEDDGDEVYVFANRDDAIECALKHPLLQAWPFQIVELDEL